MAKPSRGLARWIRFVVVLACVSGGGSATPELASQSAPIPITGSERLAFEFDAQSAEQIPRLGFTAIVDDIPIQLQGVTCHPVAGELELTCSAQLPAMSWGTHTIQVSALVDGLVHGLPSAPIRVRFEAAAESTSSRARGERRFTTVDGVRLHSVILATGLVDPTDLTIVPDGRVLIAERSGRIRVFRDGQVMPAPAVSLADVTTGDGRGLLALTVDAAFEKTRAVFALYTSASGATLVRYALYGDTLDGRAVLLDRLPLASSRPTASLRMGPDLNLYLGLDDGGDATRAADLGSYSGKVLRLNRDGTTPDDQAGHTPVFIEGMHRPAGFAWQRGSNTTWVVTREADDSERLYTVTAEGPPRRGHIIARHTLPSGVGAADLVLYDSPAIAELRGNLLVAAESEKAILRLRAEESGEITTEWLFGNAIGAVKSLAIAPDGSIYALAGDMLVQITR